jgi:hypothetical protein
MAAIVIRENAKATCLTGIAGVRAKACEMVQRGMAYAAATVLICAVGAALLQLVAEILSFPAPIAATAITLIAAALLNSLRRNTRAQARHRYGPGNPHGREARNGRSKLQAGSRTVSDAHRLAVTLHDGHALLVTTAHLYTRRDEPLGVRHQDAGNETTLHQIPQLPGSGGFYPIFYPKRRRERVEMSYLLVTATNWSGQPGVCHQPSKLVMRVRFPSPAPVHQIFRFCVPVSLDSGLSSADEPIHAIFLQLNCNPRT